ncbi:4'-phosphopantetheinyl transferase family protein [Lysinimonas soli]|uniref:4'-phosphopantetheinyl transferase family protein n=1 Tax=Lysinimonas soli TaxID=1074233 RepID=A0ABW0NTW1_9MICO
MDGIAIRFDRRTPFDPGAARAALSDDELVRYESLPAASGGSFLAGRLLLRTLAGEQLGVTPREVPLTAVCLDCGGPHGKPVILGTELRVSLSRCSVGVVAVTAWGREIGVDLEPVRGRPGRLSAIRTITGADGLEHWTRVEAVLKADGRGLRVDPREVTISESGSERYAVVSGSPSRYRIIEPGIETGGGADVQLSIAVAS